MKRRDFLTAAATTAGLGTGGFLTGIAEAATDEKRPEEAARQIYKCQKCKTIVEIVQPGRPTLVHCGVPMKLLVEKTEDEGREKHVPVIEKVDGGYKVSVGSEPHPMKKFHYITEIQLLSGDRVYTKKLEPGDEPVAVFLIDDTDVTARAYCNLHGLWKSK